MVLAPALVAPRPTALAPGSLVLLTLSLAGQVLALDLWLPT